MVKISVIQIRALTNYKNKYSFEDAMKRILVLLIDDKAFELNNEDRTILHLVKTRGINVFSEAWIMGYASDEKILAEKDKTTKTKDGKILIGFNSFYEKEINGNINNPFYMSLSFKGTKKTMNLSLKNMIQIQASVSSLLEEYYKIQ